MTTSQHCGNCMYWSEMIAMKPPGKLHIEALCLMPDSPHHTSYMPAEGTCPQWATAANGVIDDPNTKRP
jgi:hypothetical protein